MQGYTKLTTLERRLVLPLNKRLVSFTLCSMIRTPTRCMTRTQIWNMKIIKKWGHEHDKFFNNSE